MTITTTPDAIAEFVAQARAADCQFIDLQFTDVTGGLKSVVVPAHHFAEACEYGQWFDGSALEGAARAMETDLLLRPDLDTWSLLPWSDTTGRRSARVLCDVQTPDDTPFPADPRAVLKRALAVVADLSLSYHVAAEIEFFLFQPPRGRPDDDPLMSGSARGAARPLDHAGYFDHSPARTSRAPEEIVTALAALGFPVQASHHEISPGQYEVDLPWLPALRAADAIATCKYVVKTIARRHGLAATFMPKPLGEAAGSGLHLAQVLLTAGKGATGEHPGAERVNALAEPLDEYGLAATGRAFIAGQLAHLRALCAVLAPTVNSYKRLGRGFDAPSSLTWSQTAPYAAIRVPRTTPAYAALGRRGAALSPGTTRVSGNGTTGAFAEVPHVELRCPDPSCNPYLALAVSLAAGLDGVRHGTALPAPADGQTLDTVGGAERLDLASVEVLPASLGEALTELEWNAVVREALGPPVYERLLVAGEQEWQSYRQHVSEWELARYFTSA